MPAAFNEERAALLERAMREGPDFYVCRRLHHITELAREAGLEREEVAVAMIVHAVALCRPDFVSRGALASLLRREARKLAPTDEEFVKW